MDLRQRLLELCTGSGATLNVVMIGSDLSIALAYYSIPLIMLWVLRRRHEDLPYAWLWILFVAFITACGTTHLTHVYSMIAGARTWTDGVARVATAAASVGTAIAFALALPQINVLPSPKRQREELERLVRERTAEKDKAILDMYHAVGNILAVAAAAIRLQETREVDQRELRREALARIQEIAQTHQQMSEPHRRPVAVGRFGELVAKQA
jgi:hypothetical protein